MKGVTISKDYPYKRPQQSMFLEKKRRHLKMRISDAYSLLGINKNAITPHTMKEIDIKLHLVAKQVKNK